MWLLPVFFPLGYQDQIVKKKLWEFWLAESIQSLKTSWILARSRTFLADSLSSRYRAKLWHFMWYLHKYIPNWNWETSPDVLKLISETNLDLDSLSWSRDSVCPQSGGNFQPWLRCFNKYSRTFLLQNYSSYPAVCLTSVCLCSCEGPLPELSEWGYKATKLLYTTVQTGILWALRVSLSVL